MPGPKSRSLSEEAGIEWGRIRRWGRRVTLTVGVLFGLSITPYTLMCVAHSTVDSEVGVMSYGFPVLMASVIGVPLLVLPTVAWGVGIRKTQDKGASLPRWEAWTFLGIAGGLSVLLFMMSHIYWHMVVNFFTGTG